MKNAFYMEGNLWLYRLYLWVAILLWLPVSLSAAADRPKADGDNAWHDD